MSSRFALASLAFAVSVLIAGCASMKGVAPHASPRDANALATQRTLETANVSIAAWPKTDWWKAFNDRQLDALMDEALADSPTLNIAAARTRKALAAADLSHASLLPRVDGAASSTRQRYPKNELTPPPLGGSTQTLNQLQVTLAWELDFWGKNRSAYEAAVSTARAAEVDAYAARLALSATIAQAYVQLQRAYLQLDVAEATLADRERIYSLTRDRNAAGIDSRVELKQAESALPATRELIAELNERIALTRNQLAALMGLGPDRGLAIARPTAEAGQCAPTLAACAAALPPEVAQCPPSGGRAALMDIALPSTVPAELIGRRPDIIAQRWRVEAARQDIASAKAEFYPNVNLLAFVGLQSLGAANLLTAASGMIGAGPAVTLPIFDGGRLRANLAGTDADYDIAVEQYNQMVADAMREVVDQLASYRSLDEQRIQQRAALATAREAYDLALLRYREGLGNYLQVLSAEQPLHVQQSLDADLHARGLELAINLARALGGGFEAPPALANVSVK